VLFAGIEIVNHFLISPVVFCSCKASTVCSNCKVNYYCCRSHQKLHWKYHKKQCKEWKEEGLKAVDSLDYDLDALDEIQRAYCFPEYNIIIEPEETDEEHPDANEVKKEDHVNLVENKNKQYVDKLMKEGKVWEDGTKKEDGENGEEDEDAKLTQKDYNKALSEQIHDPVYVQFLTRIDKTGKDQVIRYCESSIHRQLTEQLSDAIASIEIERRDQGKLFLSSDEKKKSISVPSCPCCGAPRVFEFQVLVLLSSQLCSDSYYFLDYATTAVLSQH
jgi:hypothetical protein